MVRFWGKQLWITDAQQHHQSIHLALEEQSWSKLDGCCLVSRSSELQHTTTIRYHHVQNWTVSLWLMGQLSAAALLKNTPSWTWVPYPDCIWIFRGHAHSCSAIQSQKKVTVTKHLFACCHVGVWPSARWVRFSWTYKLFPDYKMTNAASWKTPFLRYWLKWSLKLSNIVSGNNDHHFTEPFSWLLDMNVVPWDMIHCIQTRDGLSSKNADVTDAHLRSSTSHLHASSYWRRWCLQEHSGFSTAKQYGIIMLHAHLLLHVQNLEIASTN